MIRFLWYIPFMERTDSAAYGDLHPYQHVHTHASISKVTMVCAYPQPRAHRHLHLSKITMVCAYPQPRAHGHLHIVRDAPRQRTRTSATVIPVTQCSS